MFMIKIYLKINYYGYARVCIIVRVVTQFKSGSNLKIILNVLLEILVCIVYLKNVFSIRNFRHISMFVNLFKYILQVVCLSFLFETIWFAYR